MFILHKNIKYCWRVLFRWPIRVWQLSLKCYFKCYFKIIKILYNINCIKTQKAAEREFIHKH